MLQHLSRTPLSALAPPPAPSDERLGARDVMSFVRRYAVPVGLCILVSLVLGQLYVWSTPSTFVSSTQVVIESRRGSWAGAGGDVSFAQYSLDSSQMESQIQVIKSEQISRRVVQGLDLEQDPELTQPDKTVWSTVRGWFEASGPAPAAKSTSPVVRALSERLQARRIGQSYVIEISYWSREPEKAARICNAITAAYIGDLIQGKINAAQGGSEIIERRIATLRDQRVAADKAVRTGAFETDSAFPAADARVITTALQPEARSWPRGSLVLSFSALLGLFVGLFGAAVDRGLDTSIRTRQQVAHALGLRTLGVLPRVRFRSKDSLATEVGLHPTSRFGIAVRQIRTSVELRQADGALVCLGITSMADGEGKSTLAANLAQAMADAGRHVLLVDADLRNGFLTSLLAPGASVGLVELIEGRQAAENVLVHTATRQCDFLPVRAESVGPGPAELPHSERIGELLALCRQRYDIVLIDLPSLESGPDARAISPHLDGMVFVVEQGRLRAERVAAGVESLRAANVDIVGVVIGKGADAPNV